MTALSLVALSTYLPKNIVDNSFFTGLVADNTEMFKGSKLRHHIEDTMTAEDMFTIAATKLAEEQKIELSETVDCIITNVALPDIPFTGVGAMVAKRLKIKPTTVLDMHNGGCVSFITMMEMAQILMQTKGLKNILICTAQTAAGRIFSHPENLMRAQSAIPGDGAAVALFSTTGKYRVKDIIVKCHPEYAHDMGINFDDGRKWWAPGMSVPYINFDEHKISAIVMRGFRLVPKIMNEILVRNNLKGNQLAALITNQPNPTFLRNWREAIQIPKERHIESFENLGNLFQAGIPINLDYAIRSNSLDPEGNILLAGFSHAGDYSAAAILEPV